MSYQTFYYIHTVFAYTIAVYALAIYWFDHKLARFEPGSQKYTDFNNRVTMIHRIMNFVVLAAFLVGGYLGTPFFKVGAVWIMLKVVIFVILAGIMGALGSKAMKMRKLASSSGSIEKEVLEKAQKKMDIYKNVQLILVILLFLVAYLKPFG